MLFQSFQTLRFGKGELAIEEMSQIRINLAAYDVTALHTSIDLELGLNSFRWYMQIVCNFKEGHKDIILVLACFVQTNCYIVKAR